MRRVRWSGPHGEDTGSAEDGGYGMFLGEYEHSLDAKGRVILPARIRDHLGSDEVVISKALGGCLAVYTPEQFEEVAARTWETAKRGPREQQAARALFAGASLESIDKQGRISIPAKLREFAHLDKDVVVAGMYRRIEIWDPERYRATGQAGDLEILEADSVPDLGM